MSTGYLCTALVASVVIGHVLRRLPFLVRVEFSPIFLVACGCFVIFVGLPPPMLVVWFILCVSISKARRVVTLSWSSTWG